MQRSDTQELLIKKPQINQQTQESKRTAGIAATVVATAESIDIAGVFVMTAVESLKVIFEEIARFIMLPFAALSASLLAIFAWRQAHLSQYEGYATTKAVVETLSAIALSTAIIGGLILTATFALVSPIIFAITFGLKTLFNAGSAIYFGVQASRADDESKKEEYRTKAKDALIGTIIGVLGTTAVIAVMLLAKPVMALFGIAAMLIGAGASVIKCAELIKRNKTATTSPSANSDTATMMAHLGNSYSHNNTHSSQALEDTRTPGSEETLLDEISSNHKIASKSASETPPPKKLTQ